MKAIKVAWSKGMWCEWHKGICIPLWRQSIQMQKSITHHVTAAERLATLCPRSRRVLGVHVDVSHLIWMSGALTDESVECILNQCLMRKHDQEMDKGSIIYVNDTHYHLHKYSKQGTIAFKPAQYGLHHRSSSIWQSLWGAVSPQAPSQQSVAWPRVCVHACLFGEGLRHHQMYVVLLQCSIRIWCNRWRDPRTSSFQFQRPRAQKWPPRACTCPNTAIRLIFNTEMIIDAVKINW